MARSGIGQDSYLRVQKETTYGTAVTSSMTAWPAKSGLLFKSMRENIVNDNLVTSRLKQAPNRGREVATFELPLDAHPALLGQVFQFMLGASTNAGPVDSTYTHTWLLPTSGSTVGYSFTAQQAQGSDLADTYSGCLIHEIVISSDSQGQVTMTLTGTAKGIDAEDVTRATTLSYTNKIPLNFAFAKVFLTPNGGSQVEQLCNSFELTINLGLDENRFKIGDSKQYRPNINTIPSVTLSLNVDAEKQFINYARAHTTYAILLDITSTENAAGTTKFSFKVEIPTARLNPDTAFATENDTLSMDLEFDGGYGGVTTGSGSTSVMAEVRVVDATATWA